MNDLNDKSRRVTLVIVILAKLYAALELSQRECPLCKQPSTHDSECPIELTWSPLDETAHASMRQRVRVIHPHGIEDDDDWLDILHDRWRSKGCV